MDYIIYGRIFVNNKIDIKCDLCKKRINIGEEVQYCYYNGDEKTRKLEHKICSTD